MSFRANLWIGLAVSIIIASPLIAQSAKQEVLIYYANENSPTPQEMQNYSVVADWLRTTNDPKFIETAEKYPKDQQEFQAAVDDEVAELKKARPRGQSALPGLIVTNRSLRAGYYWLREAGARTFSQHSFKVIPHDNYIVDANPAARAEVFASLLAQAAEHFNSQSHEFVLITKSHGNAEQAMTPLLVIRHETTNREQLLTYAASANSAERPDWLGPKIGVSKFEYFEILAEAGEKHGMQFALVFMESCKGDIHDDLTQSLPANVNKLYNSGSQPAEYQNLDFRTILAAHDQKQDAKISQLIDQQLAPKFQRLEHKPQPLRWTTLMWFAPLLVWLAVTIFPRISR